MDYHYRSCNHFTCNLKSDNNGKEYDCIGWGESGVGAALLGQHLGYHVFLSDKGAIGESYQKELDDHHIEWEQGKHSSERIINADLVVKAQGFPQMCQSSKKLGLLKTRAFRN